MRLRFEIRKSKEKIKPLSAYMEELLMDCHERELLKLQPHEIGSTRYCQGLLKRGLLNIREYRTDKGKTIYALYVTELGRHYLQSI